MHATLTIVSWQDWQASHNRIVAPHLAAADRAVQNLGPQAGQAVGYAAATAVLGGFVVFRQIKSITLTSPRNGAARAAVRLGVWAGVFSCMGPFALVLSIPGVVAGHVGLAVAGRKGGRSAALFGLAVSYLAVAAHVGIATMMWHASTLAPPT